MQSRSLVALAIALTVAVPAAARAQDEAPPPPAKPFTAEESARYMELGKRATGYFFDGEADLLLEMIAPEKREGLGGIEGLRQKMDQIAEQAGMMLEVVDQKMTRREGRPQFWWEANFSEFTQEPLVFSWVFTDDGMIRGAQVSPKSAARADPEE